jgi:hypothetical protein
LRGNHGKKEGLQNYTKEARFSGKIYRKCSAKLRQAAKKTGLQPVR